MTTRVLQNSVSIKLCGCCTIIARQYGNQVLCTELGLPGVIILSSICGISQQKTHSKDDPITVITSLTLGDSESDASIQDH